MIVEVKLEDGVFLEIYVRFKNKLIVMEYSFSVIFFKIEFCNLMDIILNCSLEVYKFSISSVLIDYVGLYYVGIRYLRLESDFILFLKVEVEMVVECVRRGCESYGGRQKWFCIGVKIFLIIFFLKFQILVLKYNVSIDVNYMMFVMVMLCLYWFEIKQIWIGDGCKVRLILVI